MEHALSGDEVIVKIKDKTVHGIIKDIKASKKVCDIYIVSDIEALFGTLIKNISFKDIVNTHENTNEIKSLNLKYCDKQDKNFESFVKELFQVKKDQNTTFTNLFGKEYKSVLCIYRYRNMVLKFQHIGIRSLIEDLDILNEKKSSADFDMCVFSAWCDIISSTIQITNKPDILATGVNRSLELLKLACSRLELTNDDVVNISSQLKLVFSKDQLKMINKLMTASK